MADSMQGNNCRSIDRLQKVNWQDLKVFLTVVENGSLRAAARCLSSHQSTIIRRVKGLEDTVGCRLLKRSTVGSLTSDLTTEGDGVRQLAKDLETRIDACLYDL